MFSKKAILSVLFVSVLISISTITAYATPAKPYSSYGAFFQGNTIAGTHIYGFTNDNHLLSINCL